MATRALPLRPIDTARILSWIDPKAIILTVVVAVVAYLALLPLIFLIFGSFAEGSPDSPTGITLSNYVRAYVDAKTWVMLRDSLVFAFGSAFIALAVGAGMAWIVERTNTPGRNVFYAVALMPLIIPGILHTVSWILLLSPRIGLVNVVLKDLLGVDRATPGPLSVFSMPGMMWVEGLHLSALAFLLIAAALRNMDPSLEESAATSGAGILRTLYAVTLRLMLPAVLAVFLITFVRGLEAFEVPALIGTHADIFVFTWQIYRAVQQWPPDYALAATYGMILMALTVVTLVFYHRMTARAERFAVVTGKGFRPRAMNLGPYRWVTFSFAMVYLVLAVVLPVLILVWASLLPFYVPPSLESIKTLSFAQYEAILGSNMVQRAIRNTTFLAIVSATITMLLTAVVAWIVARTRLPGRQLIDFIAFLPIAVPGIVIAVSMLWFYLTVPNPFYATIWILVIAYVTKYMPYGIRTTAASMVQIHRELEEAAQMSGASWLQTFRKVVIPLLLPAMISGWIYVAIISTRELSTSILLYTSSSIVLSIAIFDLLENGQYSSLCALAVMMMVALAGLTYLYRRLGGRAAA